jgi:cyclase
MLRTRVIPCLLLKGEGLVKTVRFREPKYVGDPINAVKLFNDLEVDELCFFDITATPEQREPDYERIREIAGEAFMPIGYGGGLSCVAQARKLFQIGVEKVILTTAALQRPEFISELADEFGSQSIVVGLDVQRNWLGRLRLRSRCGTRWTAREPVEFAQEAQGRGAGELLVNSIDRDGVQGGYDLELIQSVSSAVSIPVIACGGAGTVAHLGEAVRAGASAAAAGSLFVFNGPHRAVLISYPSGPQLREAMTSSGGSNLSTPCSRSVAALKR